ncbi:SIMPL domain-containing protein [candidate division KSB1 bacterium]|nr:SIMPL domain-containing protein [candidate division KSB1 bacterium]
MAEVFMHEKFPRYFFAGLTMIALGLVSVGWFTATAIRDAKRANDVITVTGSARKTIRSDYGSWHIETAFFSTDIREAFDGVKRRTEAILNFLKLRHVPDSTITLAGVKQESQFDRKTGAFLGFSCVQRMDVSSALVDSLDRWSKDISELLPALIDLRSDPPAYFYTKLAELRVTMLAEATLDAKHRAEMIASSAGGRIGAIRNARMGVIQVTAPNSREVRDYGIYDTSTIEKDVTAVVSASFAVE